MYPSTLLYDGQAGECVVLSCYDLIWILLVGKEAVHIFTWFLAIWVNSVKYLFTFLVLFSPLVYCLAFIDSQKLIIFSRYSLLGCGLNFFSFFFPLLERFYWLIDWLIDLLLYDGFFYLFFILKLVNIQCSFVFGSRMQWFITYI